MDPKKDTWKKEDKLAWLAKQRQERSYREKVLGRLEKLAQSNERIRLTQYGSLKLQDCKQIALADQTLSADEYMKRYPVFYAKVGDFQKNKPSLIVTGGTHGYEESGVYGALDFLERDAGQNSEHFNFLVFPCLSPFSFEINQRWTHDAWDPNRSFDRSKPYVPEAQLVMDTVEATHKTMSQKFAAAVDLHETPDRDRVLMPPQYARYGIELTPENMQIPQGYYLIAHALNKDPSMATSIVDSVRQVTTIAPDEKIDGVDNIKGVVTSLFEDPTMAGLNLSFMKIYADNAFTTEIYPEIHPPPRGLEEARSAQRMTVLAVVNYLKANRGLS